MQSQTYFGADSRIHALLMEHLDRQQFEVHVALNKGNNGGSAAADSIESLSNVYVKPINFGPSVFGLSKTEKARLALVEGLPVAPSLIDLVAYVRRNKIDLIHCTEKPRDALYGFLISRLSGAKCLIHLHVKAEDWINASVRWSMRHADALVGVSKFVQESIVDLGYPHDKTYFVHNALDISCWDPTLNGSAIREEFGIPSHTPVLVAVSRLFYWKGHQELLQALGKVSRSVPDFKLLIVGEDDPRGYPEGGSFSQKLQQIATELGLENNVIFTGFRSDVPLLLATSDIYAMPSFEEPFGMVFLEAMAMKKPVVALDNGGTKEVVQHGTCGLLSPPNDIDALASNIVTLMNDPVLRQKMGEAGRLRAESEFTPEKLASNFAQLYKRLILAG